ncbi:MAG: transcription initiation protein [Candidatus Fluviicola riflensis]|nr:MAG: transcription initiation protein [Candidatus Fluviicola riflensis]OGS79738.1 MAG: transcription initiation protein [Candidatus Fluviicola riflensis]OGS87171.1 MAG: transcription initiation protein [Fluviicola sp. RIFCSPHIGHO2_01_FULL_43_53]OGS89959.1 MAG: transcription initiation protein [Fluviicola sp. RIFCSPHIGHO2_12_FULL_43_24]
MKEFLLVFRRPGAGDEQLQPLSPEQIQAMMKPWQDWMGSLAAQNKLVNAGNRLEHDGRVVKPNAVITNGPYVEIKEAIGGYTIIRANSLDEAAELSKGCPILSIGGTVEVRTIVPMD